MAKEKDYTNVAISKESHKILRVVSALEGKPIKVILDELVAELKEKKDLGKLEARAA